MKMFSKIGHSLLILPFTIVAIDNPHFWRATNFLPQFYEPRLAKSWLTSLDITAGYGQTGSGRNLNGQKVPLLAISGPERMVTLAIGLPDLNFSSPVDIALQNLALLGCSCGFGELEFHGKFKLIESNFCFTQNFSCGFFGQIHFPLRKIQISNIRFCDLSPACCAVVPNASNPYWQAFLNLFPQFLTEFGLSLTDGGSCSDTKIGIGDTTALLGWTYNYEDTDELDYIDFSLRIGVLAPTGKKRNPNVVFDIPNGYGGHIGIPMSMNFAIGYYEWLTLGAHFGAMTFIRKEGCFRFHTDPSQNGYIKLLPGAASEHEGTIWEANGYLKADHFAGGASFFAGYSFALQQKNTLKPCDLTFLTLNDVNDDPTLAGWKMHTVQFMFEYDFAKPGRCFGPRIGLFYNVVAGGTHIFNTNMEGGFLGLDIAYDF